MTQNQAPVVRQADARILREALAKIWKTGHPAIRVMCDQALRAFAASVRPICGHPETVMVETEGKHACLDCGTRITVSGEQLAFPFAKNAPPPETI